MNTIELKNNLTEKLALLSLEQLQLVSQLVEQLILVKDIYSYEDILKAVNKWKYLLTNNQELNEYEPLSNQEIKMICQFLTKQNKTRPVGLAKGELTIPDGFNDPLPDEIIDLFYQ